MERSQNPVIIWLMIGALLVVTMVVVGGITRLTQSGLSMVEWNLVMGSIPPLNESDWQETFEKYKESPEFNIVNYEFGLEDFKSIFWWEYIHRMLGRLIGLVFIVPFLIFIYQKRIDNTLLKRLVLIFILGAFQGFLGWYMVKSGLVKDPHVSHYRLAAHLIAALTLFSLIFWTALELIYNKNESKKDLFNLRKTKKLAIVGTIILTTQIIYGAFVAGLKAGLYYNTWPKMGIKWIPSEVGNAISREGLISLVDNISVVQFIHRYLAWIVAIIVVMLFYRIRKSFSDTELWPGAKFLLGTTVLQILLGIFTLVYQVPVSLGVIHQLGSVFLLGGFTFLWQRSSTKT